MCHVATVGGRGPALPGPQRACFSAARAARAASGSDGVGTSPQRDFRVWKFRKGTTL